MGDPEQATGHVFSLSDLKKIFKSRTFLEKVLMLIVILLSISLVVIIAKFPDHRRYGAEPDMTACRTEACMFLGTSILNSLDTKADPCTDFYSYACGNWLKEVDIPGDLEEYGLLDLLRSRVVKKVNDLLWNVNFSSSIYAAQNACTFYMSCMDTNRIESDGIKPLMDFIEDIGQWPVAQKNWNASAYDVSHAIAEVQLRTGYGFVIALMIRTDPGNMSNNIISISPSKLALSSDVLLNPNSNYSRTELKNYKKFFIKIARLVGAVEDEAFLSAQFQDIVDLETILLKSRTYGGEQEFKAEVSSKVTVKELCAEIPDFDWLRYFQKVTNSTLLQLGEKAVVKPDDLVLVYDFPYMKRISGILQNWRFSRQIANYLGWSVITYQLNHLPSKFNDALQDYIRDSGFVPHAQQRWVMCTRSAINSFSNVLSLMYIQEYFPEEVRNEVMKLVYDIKFQFETSLKRNLWMDLSTKLAALTKLNAMKVNIGHPDWLFNEEVVELNYIKRNMPNMTTSAFKNNLALSTHESMELISKLRQRNTDNVWMILPVTVNAGYNRNMNGITFPAAFLQGPLYEPDVPQFYNYATIGSIIGHEITHGFDNEGRKRNAFGDYDNWWSSDSEKKFFNKSECFINQYNSYGVDGEQTLAENIADNGGLRQSYKAFSQWMKNRKTVQSLPGLEKFTIKQQFFLSYGSMWCMKYKRGLWNVSSEFDVHSPSPIRLKGSIENLAEFYEAFSCAKKQPGNNVGKCVIW